MKLNKWWLSLLLPSMLLGGCTSKSVDLKVICSTDVHGNFFPYDFCSDKPAGGSLARLSTFLNEQRQLVGEDNVVYIDNGDILQGQPTAYYYNTVAVSEPHLAAEVLNYLHCDVATLGNHDIEPGGPTYQRYIRDCKFPMTCANIMMENSDVNFLPPYIVVERQGVKLAFMGMITPAIPNWLPHNLWKELVFEDMETTARKWMKVLKEEVRPDIIIGLFHSGKEGGIITDEYAENASVAVAKNVPGFDAVFFGHDHRPMNDRIVNVEGDTVHLINAGKHAEWAGLLDIHVEKGSKPTFHFESGLVSMDKYEPDTAYMNHFAEQMERVKKYVSKPIGKFTKKISSQDAFFGPCDFVDFIHQMQLDISNAQISFAAPLSMNVSLPQGEVYVRDMFNLYRFENQLYLMKLTGKEIKDYLEMSYGDWINQMKSPDDHLLLFDEHKKGKDGRPYLKNIYFNFDSAAGIIYEVDVRKPTGQRICIKSMANGDPFEMDKLYYVAINSYRGNGGGELLTKGAGIPKEDLTKRLELSTDVDLRFYMLNYIEQREELTPKTLNHWKFVPESWAKPAAERDRKLLFGN